MYSEDLPDDVPPAGTHGQIWLVLVPNGVPAADPLRGVLRGHDRPDLGGGDRNVRVLGQRRLGHRGPADRRVLVLLPSQLPVLMALGGLGAL